MKWLKKNRWKESAIKVFFFANGVLAVTILIGIFAILLYTAFPAFKEISFAVFFVNKIWDPTSPESASEDFLNAVPSACAEASLALGASRWQTLVWIKVPAALSGISASFMLGMGRAIGETMTVLMATGNARSFPHGFLNSVRTMTANIAIELVLFVITFFGNLVADIILNKYK